MRKSTTVPLISLCVAGLLAVAYHPTHAAEAAAAPKAVPAAAAKPDSAKPAANTAKPAAKPTAKPAVDSAKPAVDSTATAKPDSLKAAADTAPVAPAVVAVDSARADSAASDSIPSTTVKAKKRKRIVRETTVNTIDELKGKYRSPKKALFMSLVVPGLGQAYVGQHWANYSRGAAYFLADVALIYGWHQYVVVKQDRQIARYRTFADANWRQSKYEDSIRVAPEKLDDRNEHRESYCEAVQERVSAKGASLYNACKSEPGGPEYGNFVDVHDDRNLSDDSISTLRGRFPNSLGFYELIGKHPEFITGWADADRVSMGDSSFYAMDDDGNALKDRFNEFVLATTPMQQNYIGMRAKANEYARMQAWFLGGMVINHIVSALDAALTAHYHNKALYQTEVRWWDRVRLDSRIVMDGLAPAPNLTAYLTF